MIALRAMLLGLCGLLGLPAGAAALPRQRIVDSAALTLFADMGGALEARAVDTGGNDLEPPHGRLAVRARLPAGSVLAPRMVVYVDIDVDARHWRTEAVWFVVQAQRPVWVARMPLAAGLVPGDAHLARETREVTSLASPPWPGGEPLAGLRLRTSLDAGEVLTARAVEAAPAVARNQPVRVRVLAGGVELETAGVVLNDARIGESVRVLNPASQQSFRARVIANGLVVAGAR